MTIKLSLLTATVLIATAHSAFAYGATDRVDTRQSMQSDRIEAGRRNGEITWTEGIKLRAEQRRIEAAERAFKADDGRIDKHEYRQLKAMQDEASRHIAVEAHDRRHRPSWLPRVGR
jgi:hypothetical protein